MVPTGFLLRTELESSQMRNLPDYFTNISRAKSGKSVTMTTLPLKKLNARLVDSMNEVCNMSESIIDELIEKITGRIASLNKVRRRETCQPMYNDMDRSRCKCLFFCGLAKGIGSISSFGHDC